VENCMEFIYTDYRLFTSLSLCVCVKRERERRERQKHFRRLEVEGLYHVYS
jgi:hypothetical protein